MGDEKNKTSIKSVMMSSALLAAAMSGISYREAQKPQPKAPPSPETKEARHRQKMARKKQRRSQR